MRKLSLSLFSCMALVAFMGMSATAYALHDPACDPNWDPERIQGFQMDSTNHWARAVAGISGSAYACGSDISGSSAGAGSLYNHADISVPAGVQINDSNNVAVGSYAASASVNVLYHAFLGSWFQPGVLSEVRTDDKAQCINQRDNEIVGLTPQGAIVSCLHGTNALGESWTWSTRETDGDLWTTIGPMHGTLGIEPGLTFVDLDLCGSFGSTSGAECGYGGPSSPNWQQKNGSHGTGTYTITATQEDGTVTPSASASIEWRDHLVEAAPGYGNPIGG